MGKLVVAAAGLVVLIAAVAAGAGPAVSATPSPTIRLPGIATTTIVSATTTLRRSPGGAAGNPQDLELVLAVLAATLFAAVLGWLAWMVVRWFRTRDLVWTHDHGERDRDPAVIAPGNEQVLGDLLAGVDAAQTALDESDPRQAVLACWLQLEKSVAHTGVARRPSETSGELTRRVLVTYAVDGPGLDTLQRLYGQARYSPAEVPVDARDEARQALATVRVGIEQGLRPAPVESAEAGVAPT